MLCSRFSFCHLLCIYVCMCVCSSADSFWESKRNCAHALQNSILVEMLWTTGNRHRSGIGLNDIFIFPSVFFFIWLKEKPCSGNDTDSPTLLIFECTFILRIICIANALQLFNRFFFRCSFCTFRCQKCNWMKQNREEKKTSKIWKKKKATIWKQYNQIIIKAPFVLLEAIKNILVHNLYELNILSLSSVASR